MSRHKGERDLRDQIKAMGWTVHLTARRHMKCVKDGLPIQILAYSTDPRGWKNSLARLRRIERQLSDTRKK